MENQLNFAQRAWQDMNKYLDQQAADAAQKFSKLKTAEELKKFLTDRTQIITPGFILRRQFQHNLRNETFDLSASTRKIIKAWTNVEFPNLDEQGNLPWAESVVDKVADILSKDCYQQGHVVEPKNWKGYLTDRQKITRQMAFKLAILTGMSRECTQDLLCACGESPCYNLRDRTELIYYYCQAVPGVFTWRGVSSILQDTASEGKKAAQDKRSVKICEPIHSGNTTFLIKWNVDEILGRAVTREESEGELKKFIAENCGKLEGFSQTARKNFLRILDYLQTLYLPEKKGKLKYKPLISAMFEQTDWNFDDLFQNSGEGGQYIFRGEKSDKFASDNDFITQSETHSFRGEERLLGAVAVLCKYLRDKVLAIKRGSVAVDRRVVLILVYFLLLGFASAGEAQRRSLWERAASQEQAMDNRLNDVRGAIESLAKKPEISERKKLYVRVINELLAGCGLRSLHPRMPYDRFVLLTLLSEDPTWTARFLMADELSYLEV